MGDSAGPRVAADHDTEGCVLAYLARLLEARSVEQAWALHTEQMARHGFDRVIYSFASLPGDVDVLADTLILSNHPRSFLDPFLAEGWWRQPLFLTHADKTGMAAVPWRVTPGMAVSLHNLRALAFRASHGVVAGYTLSFRAVTPQGRAGTGLCARAGLDQDAVDRIWARHGPTVKLMNTAFHLRVTALPIRLPGRRLTRRQREVLAWMGDGKSVRDVAVLTGLRPGTVEKHLALARAALGVQTTAQAVLKAAMLNQLFRRPPRPDAPRRG